MKVLVPGRDQNGWSINFTCSGDGNGGGGCGAQLLVEQGDLRRHTGMDISGTSDHYVLFQCVACGVWTDLPSRDWPPASIRNTLATYIPIPRSDSR